MLKRSPRILPAYDGDRLGQILHVLSRASKDAPEIALERLEKMREQLESDLLSLIHSTGLAHDGSADSMAWHEFTSDTPGHAQLAAGFEAMAEAPNPLDPRVCTADLRTGINGQIRMRWTSRWKRQRRKGEPSLRTVDWEFLSIAEREEIRVMARHLARYHGSSVRRGRVQKADLDAAVTGLADIFLRYTGSSAPRDEVAYARESRFIQFAALALEPAAMYFEVSDSALSGRWERLVKPPEPAQRIALKPKKKRLLTP